MSLFPDIPLNPNDDEKGARFDPDRVHRYRCWRIWNPALPMLAWLMLNPSTADERELDPTLGRVRDFSVAWGFGGFEVWNLWSLRSTDPRGLWGWLKAGDQRLHFEANTTAILAELPRFKDVVCAWGNFSMCPASQRAEAVETARKTTTVLSSSAALWCLGRTLSGQPIHPMARGQHRIPDDQQRLPFLPAGQ